MTMTTTTAAAVDLFGGAMSASIPPSWRDVSKIRQVPDNQEVYQDCDDATGAVLVFEILERQSDVTNEDACSFFLDDLADANEAEAKAVVSSEVLVVDLLRDGKEKARLLPNFKIPDDSASSSGGRLYACLASGVQRGVARGKGGGGSTAKSPAARCIDVDICVLRLEGGADTDLLITLSVPRKGNNVEEEKSNDKEGMVGRDACRGDDDNVFRAVLGTFDIKDWSLFHG